MVSKETIIDLSELDLDHVVADTAEIRKFIPQRFEMEQLSGQPLSPCVVINGTMLADISGEEVEAYMLANGLVGEATQSTNVPLNAPCSDEEHAAMVNVRS